MNSNEEKCQPLMETTEDQFNKIINGFINKRLDNEKPLWTRGRIEEAIAAIEQFKLAPILKLQRTHQQYYYAKKYEIMGVGSKKKLILKRTSDSDPIVKIVPVESFYGILRQIHRSTGHGGRDKMLYNLKTKYLIPTSVVMEFLKLCKICRSKKKFIRKGIAGSPKTITDFNHRGQVDLVDLRSTPDRNYKWLLHYQDHATKFSFLRPLCSKRAAEIATELLKIFLEVGCPQILHSDRGRKFIAAVIEELTSLWPTCKIINGKPKLPASEGSAEQSNQDVEAMLRAWLTDNGTTNWAVGCYFVQFQNNSAFHQTIKQTPYKALFGTEPKTGLSSKLISNELLEKVVNEEDLDLLLNAADASLTSTQKDLPAASSDKNGDPNLKDLMNCGASTSNGVSEGTPSKSKTSPSRADSHISNTRRCIVCKMKTTRIHLCAICRNPLHELCGRTVVEKGEGAEKEKSKILCHLCDNKKAIKDERKRAAKHLKKSTKKMKVVS